jgi:hypothetical protein
MNIEDTMQTEEEFRALAEKQSEQLLRMNLGFFQCHPYLYFRLCWSASVLKPVEPKYRVEYEDPDDPDSPVKVLVPSPQWLAAALHGKILPDISAYLADQKTMSDYEQEHGSMEGFNWLDHKAQHPTAKPRGPMTEEEAMEYLIMKDIPARVWRDYEGNRQIMKIVPVEAIPSDRSYRNAWVITQDENELEQAA